MNYSLKAIISILLAFIIVNCAFSFCNQIHIIEI